LGVSVWVEVLLDKYFSHRPTERLLTQWRLLGLDVAAGTVTDGLQRLEPLFEPLYQALLARNALSKYAQADETRWPVFIVQEGKTGHCWWLWIFLGEDTVVFRLDPHRSHDVPESHFAADARVPALLAKGGRLAIVEDEGFSGVIRAEMVEVVDYEAHNSFSILVLARSTIPVRRPIKHTIMQSPDRFVNTVFMLHSF